MALLDVEALSVDFHLPSGTLRAIEDVRLSVEAGEVLGVVGETGSGKSVTVRSIMGLLPAPGRVAAGRILFDGADLVQLSQRRMRQVRAVGISFVAQNPFGALNPVLSVGRQFRNLVRAHERASNQEIHERSLAALASVQIDDRERVLAGYAHELSGGMAQRVVIAMALMLNPSVVIADEPTTALDLTTQRQILDLVRQLVVQDRRAMILVTHDMGVVANYCDSMAVMYAGRVVECGATAAVLRSPTHQYTKALLDSVPRRGRETTGIPGSAPSLANRPGGCSFAPRCAAATQVCTDSVPPVQRRADGREFACHHPVGAQ